MTRILNIEYSFQTLQPNLRKAHLGKKTMKKKTFFLGPTHHEKIILSRRLFWSIKSLKLYKQIYETLKFERFACSSMLT